MHILMLPSWYPKTEGDFHGSFFREQAEALARAGHRLGVLAIEPLSVTQAWSSRASLLGPAAESREAGVVVQRASAVRPIPMAHACNARAIARRWERCYRAYADRHGVPDVLHAHAMNPAGIAAELISRRHGIPFIVTEHRPETAPAELASTGLSGLLRGGAERAASLVAVSPAFADTLNEAYRIQRWTSIPNLLPQQFERAQIRRDAGRAFVFGHVSNLHPYKGVPLLLSAFEQAFGADPGVRLRIAGESEYRAGLEIMARSLGLSNVEFVGAVSRARIAEEFGAYDSFVMPSSAESFGVVFWEAMACGLPIVATDTDGGRYAVRTGTGLLVEAGDQDELAAQLLRMRDTAQDYDREAIREASIRECGFDTFIERYTAEYSRALEGRA